MNLRLSSDIGDNCKDIGEYLKREREARQISLQEIANATKIAKHRLASIENNKRDQWPAEIFVKGFIKSYSEYIGLDTTDVMNRYHEFLACQAAETEPRAETASSSHKKTGFRKINRPLIPITASLLLLTAAAGIWFFRGDLIKMTSDSSPKISNAEAGSLLSGTSGAMHKQAASTDTDKAESHSKKTDI
jgi:cytoskeletal protein RodZ